MGIFFGPKTKQAPKAESTATKLSPKMLKELEERMRMLTDHQLLKQVEITLAAEAIAKSNAESNLWVWARQRQRLVLI